MAMSLKTNFLLLAAVMIVMSIAAHPGFAQTHAVDLEASNGDSLLHVNADGGFAVYGTHGLGAIPAVGAGSRMMWFPAKSAFRAGSVNQSAWSLSNIGHFSVAFGSDTKASGSYSTALGNGTTANGTESTALGGNTGASGDQSLATGSGTIASGKQSTAMGYATTATGKRATAMGSDATASGETSLAIGLTGPYASPGATASGVGSFAVGSETEASGAFSVAIGGNSTTALSATASGEGSVAIGADRAVASAEGAFAIGHRVTSSGLQSYAFGYDATASRRYSFAFGQGVEATSDRGMALGYEAVTGPNPGAMVISTGQGAGSGLDFQAAGENQFAVNAAHFWFGDDDQGVTYNTSRLIETSTGAYLSDGGTWTNASDSTAKENYRAVNDEVLLGKIVDLPVTSWNYKSEDSSVRHMGPTAQEFYAAFGLGDSKKAISTVDIDGVNMAAVQALAKRTRALQQQNAELEQRLAKLEQQHTSRLLPAGIPAATGGLLGVALLIGLGALYRRRN